MNQNSLFTPTDLGESWGWMYADGGSRGNPGPAAAGWVVYDDDKTELERNGAYVGHDTNNVAEYWGVIHGLTCAQSHGLTHLRVRLDSDLIVKQMNRIYRVKHPKLRPLYAQVQDLVTQFAHVEFAHVRRQYNKVADAEVNRVLDRHPRR